MCLAACAVCWSMAFVWQGDVTQTQCNLYPWLPYLPASFVVHMNNIKAYRLSVFLRSDGHQKLFTHFKVLRITLAWTLVSAILILVGVLIDPPHRVLAIENQYLISENRYKCSTGPALQGVLYAFVTGHFVLSIYYIVSVRNGMEAFKDGMIIKEAFVIFYALIFIAFTLSLLNLKPSTIYVYRTAMVSTAITALMLRLLIGRCVHCWLPEAYINKMLHIHKTYVKPIVAPDSTVHALSSHHGRNASMPSSLFDEDSPLYAKEVVTENNVDEMIAVLGEPPRAKIFLSLASKCLCMENVDFVMKVLDYRKDAANFLRESSGQASNRLREKAKEIVVKHVEASSDDQVNLSSKVRVATEKFVKEWGTDVPFLSDDSARLAVENDVAKRLQAFDPAFKEISAMLYQNLWNKFRTEEARFLAGGESKHSLEKIYAVEEV